MIKSPIVKPASDRTILVQFGSGISEDIRTHVLFYSKAFVRSLNSIINDISPGYTSILVRLKKEIPISKGLVEINKLLKSHTEINISNPKTVKIPVCYDEEFSPDMKRVIKHTGYSSCEIIKRHLSGDYVVYFIGFSPGFPYIGGMDQALETPRLESPRFAVPAGAVAIGGKQTGIYPIESPGGWNIIGRTHLPLFNWSTLGSSPIKIGNRIEFHAVSKNKLLSLNK